MNPRTEALRRRSLDARPSVSAERAVSRAMGGSCSMPLAAHAVWKGMQLQLKAAWGESEDIPAIPVTPALAGLVTASLTLAAADLDAAAAMGEQVAAQLQAGGARIHVKPDVK